MASTTMDVRLITRNDSLASWQEKNPVLLKGEQIIVWDAGIPHRKTGDGVQAFNELPYDNVDLSDYYTKDAVDTAVETAKEDAVGDAKRYTDQRAAASIRIKGVLDTLGELDDIVDPENGDAYIIRIDGSPEYVWVEEEAEWECLGTAVDLTLYCTTEQLNAAIGDAKTTVEKSDTNGNIKVNGTETQVYSLPDTVLQSTDTLILQGGNA